MGRSNTTVRCPGLSQTQPPPHTNPLRNKKNKTGGNELQMKVTNKRGRTWIKENKGNTVSLSSWILTYMMWLKQLHTDWRELDASWRRRGERGTSYLVSSVCSHSIIYSWLLQWFWFEFIMQLLDVTDPLINWVTHWDSLPPADTCPPAASVCPSVLLLPLQTAAAAGRRRERGE